MLSFLFCTIASYVEGKGYTFYLSLARLRHSHWNIYLRRLLYGYKGPMPRIKTKTTSKMKFCYYTTCSYCENILLEMALTHVGTHVYCNTPSIVVFSNLACFSSLWTHMWCLWFCQIMFLSMSFPSDKMQYSISIWQYHTMYVYFVHVSRSWCEYLHCCISMHIVHYGISACKRVEWNSNAL